MSLIRRLSLLCLVPVLLSACAGPTVRQQGYAKMPDTRTFEYEFPVVWKAIESALYNYRIIDRDPEDVDANELKKISERSLETEWVYGQSRDKYQEYRVNGFPRKQYLQTRIKYRIQARRVIGGTTVQVRTQEEIERLNADGGSAGYTSASEVDSSRAQEILDKINGSILSAAP